EEAVGLASELRHGKVKPGRSWQGWFVTVGDQHGHQGDSVPIADMPDEKGLPFACPAEPNDKSDRMLGGAAPQPPAVGPLGHPQTRRQGAGAVWAARPLANLALAAALCAEHRRRIR